MTKLFIVDDHYMVIEGIKALLNNDKSIEWMGHAGNADSCLAFLKLHQPDIILLDINLPDISGIELCKTITDTYPGISVIALSTFNQHSYVQKMLDNGAIGYLLKNATREEIIEAIINVKKGIKYLSIEAAQVLRHAAVPEALLLTRREKEVLDLIADGLTNQEIADKLFVSATTVVTHRTHLLQKLNAKNTAALIKTAALKGLISNNTAL